MEDIDRGSASEVALRLKTAPVEDLPELVRRYAEDPRTSVISALRSASRRLDVYEAERAHTKSLYDLMWEMGGQGIVFGLDEVGRGACAGPLTVGCVALPPEPLIIGIDDSKKLKPSRREDLAREIRAHAIAMGIAHVPPEEIDASGMAAALRVAMTEAIRDAGITPDAILIDGNPLHLGLGERYLVKGDGRIAAIAAASIVAKVTRDAIMVAADADYPGYGFASSKGYASAEHIAAIREKGLTDFHRKSFCGAFVNVQQNLF